VPLDPQLLQFIDLVDLASDESTSIPLTIIVGGAVITGECIGEPAYWKSYGVRIASAASYKDKGQHDEVVAVYSRKGYEAVNERRRQSQLPRFIHFSDAKLVTGAIVAPQGEGLLLRVQLDEVQAWSWGRLEATPHVTPPGIRRKP
jgi:hypothetical protein